MLVNPEGLYGGGAFKVNLDPAVNFLLKKQAQEQAQSAALDKYYKNALSKATSTGMRAQEMPAFEQAVNNYKQFYIQNARELSRGNNPQLSYEAEQLMRVPFQIANDSKELYNTTKSMDQIRATNNKQAALYSPETLGYDPKTNQPVLDAEGNPMGLSAHEQPAYTIDEQSGQVIKNPKFKHFDLNQITYLPEPYEGKDFVNVIQNSVANIKPSQRKESRPNPKDKFSNIETTYVEYDPNQLQDMGNIYANLYDQDKRMKATFDDNHPFSEWSEKNAEDFNKANDAFKMVYGRDIEPGNNKELFAAIQLQPAVTPQTKEDIVSNKQAAMDYAAELSRRNSDRAIQLAASLKQQTGRDVDINTVETGFERIPDGTYNNGQVTIRNGMAYDATGKPYTSDVSIPKSKISTDILNKIPSGDREVVKMMNITYSNGKPVAASANIGRTGSTGIIYRSDVANEAVRKAGYKPTISNITQPKGGTQQGTKATKKKGGLNDL
jgi:hypothetical protein